MLNKNLNVVVFLFEYSFISELLCPTIFDVFGNFINSYSFSFIFQSVLVYIDSNLDKKFCYYHDHVNIMYYIKIFKESCITLALYVLSIFLISTYLT